MFLSFLKFNVSSHLWLLLCGVLCHHLLASLSWLKQVKKNLIIIFSLINYYYVIKYQEQFKTPNLAKWIPMDTGNNMYYNTWVGKCIKTNPTIRMLSFMHSTSQTNPSIKMLSFMHSTSQKHFSLVVGNYDFQTILSKLIKICKLQGVPEKKVTLLSPSSLLIKHVCNFY